MEGKLGMAVLFVVATPIGNLQDWSPRAVETLKNADLIVAEDTRVTGKLCQIYGIHTSLTSCHQHNESGKGEYLAEKMAAGEEYFFHGKIARDGFHFQVVNPVFDQRQKGEGNLSPILPIYPLTSGLKQGHIRAIVNVALDKALPLLSEVLPSFFRKEQKLCAITYAYEKIHRPETMEELEIARKYLVFEELFLLRAALSVYKKEQKDY